MLLFYIPCYRLFDYQFDRFFGVNFTSSIHSVILTHFQRLFPFDQTLFNELMILFRIPYKTTDAQNDRSHQSSPPAPHSTLKTGIHVY
jgi:hypothetical protein